VHGSAESSKRWAHETVPIGARIKPWERFGYQTKRLSLRVKRIETDEAMVRLSLVLLFVFGAIAWGQNAAPFPPLFTPKPSAQTEMQRWLATTDAQWQPVFAKDVTDRYGAEVTQLGQQYVAALDGNIAKASSAGNLDLTLALRKEREHFLAAKSVPATDDKADPSALKEMRAAFRTQAAHLEMDRVARAKALHDRYDQFLEQAQIKLTQQQRIDDALAVKSQREAIAKEWLGALAEASAGNADRAATTAPPPSTPVPFTSSAPSHASSAEAIEALFVGKTWVSPAGTEYAFEPKGAGHTQGDTLKWHFIGSRTIEVELVGKPRINTRYFKFVSATEAFYNGDRNDITKPIHLK
jgi:hypothetical protein